MKIVSFNINGLRARPHQLAALIEKHQPDPTRGLGSGSTSLLVLMKFDAFTGQNFGPF